MSRYATVHSEFWHCETFEDACDASVEMIGDRNETAIRAAMLYLITAPDANMIGVWRCPVSRVAASFAMPEEKIIGALACLHEIDFLTYDVKSETVFVHNMLLLQGGVTKISDNRFKGVQNLYEKISVFGIKKVFFEKYGDQFDLEEPVKQERRKRQNDYANGLASFFRNNKDLAANHNGLEAGLQAGRPDLEAGLQAGLQATGIQVQGTDTGIQGTGIERASAHAPASGRDTKPVDNFSGFEKTATLEKNTDQEEKPKPVAKPADKPKSSRRASRGCRIPDDWELDNEYLETARATLPGVPDAVFTFEAAKFKDYWLAKTGASAVKKDWMATWRNWLRNVQTFNGGSGLLVNENGRPLNKQEVLELQNRQVAAEIIHKSIAGSSEMKDINPEPEPAEKEDSNPFDPDNPYDLPRWALNDGSAFLKEFGIS